MKLTKLFLYFRQNPQYLFLFVHVALLIFLPLLYFINGHVESWGLFLLFELLGLLIFLLIVLLYLFSIYPKKYYDALRFTKINLMILSMGLRKQNHDRDFSLSIFNKVLYTF